MRTNTPPLWRPSTADTRRATRPGSVTAGWGPHPGQLRQGTVDALLGQLDVLEAAGEVGVVGGHVEVAMAGEVDQDGAGLARLAGRERLHDAGRLSRESSHSR
jgi:hypothetical protein